MKLRLLLFILMFPSIALACGSNNCIKSFDFSSSNNLIQSISIDWTLSHFMAARNTVEPSYSGAHVPDFDNKVPSKNSSSHTPFFMRPLLDGNYFAYRSAELQYLGSGSALVPIHGADILENAWYGQMSLIMPMFIKSRDALQVEAGVLYLENRIYQLEGMHSVPTHFYYSFWDPVKEDAVSFLFANGSKSSLADSLTSIGCIEMLTGRTLFKSMASGQRSRLSKKVASSKFKWANVNSKTLDSCEPAKSEVYQLAF